MFPNQEQPSAAHIFQAGIKVGRGLDIQYALELKKQ